MPIQDFGAVCDTSALTDRKSLTKAQTLFKNSGLYIPNPTYSWLSRSKLIEVRHQTVKYSLISELVRERKIFPIHLPELYDEISRQIMFKTDHNVALTDLRGLLLSGHMQLPILTFDDGLVERISEEIGIHTIRSFEIHANWLNLRNALELYRELSFGSGKQFQEQLQNGKSFPKAVQGIKESCEKNLENTEKTAKKISQDQTNPGTLQLRYLAWDTIPSIREYHEQKILPEKIIRQICEKNILLIAKPSKS